MTMKIGAKVPNSGPLPGRLGIGTMAAELEDAGFESLWVSDHIVLPETIDSRYPFAEDGRALLAAFRGLANNGSPFSSLFALRAAKDLFGK